MKVGPLRHMVTLQNPGTVVPDGEGGWTTVDTSGAEVFASIEPATQRDLERLVANSVGSDASHVVTMRYIPGVTTKTRLLFNARTFDVVGVQNPEERNVELRLACVERVA